MINRPTHHPKHAADFFRQPGVVGVTGHRLNRLTKGHVAALADVARDLFADPAPDCSLLSCMAEGTDIILAEAWPSDRALLALLATPPAAWCRRMDEMITIGRCQDLLARAALEVMPEPVSPDYVALAERLAARADRIFAVWDGAPGKPGGTGSVVRRARALGKPVLHLRFYDDGFDWVSKPAG